MVLFCPFYCRAPVLKPSSRKNGTLTIKRLLRNQGIRSPKSLLVFEVTLTPSMGVKPVEGSQDYAVTRSGDSIPCWLSLKVCGGGGGWVKLGLGFRGVGFWGAMGIGYLA